MGRRRNGGCFGCGCGCFSGLALVVIGVAVLCGGLLWFINTNMPGELDPNFTPSQSLANNFESKLQAASRNASQTGSFNLQVTQAEAASWLNLNVPQDENNTTPFENIQVKFQNGEALVYGESRLWDMFTVASQFGVTMAVTTQGQLDVTVVTANIGGVEMPESTKADISAEIKRIIDEELKDVNQTYRVTSVNISDGRLTISGRAGR